MRRFWSGLTGLEAVECDVPSDLARKPSITKNRAKTRFFRKIFRKHSLIELGDGSFDAEEGAGEKESLGDCIGPTVRE